MTTAPIVRTVVVDDEPVAREAVVTLLENEPAIEVVGEAGNGREAVDVIRSTRPDLLFLDVQMPDLDGFDVLERLGSGVPRAVVFVTAHDEHALRAFDVHALDYLLKPFGKPRFRAAVARALDRLSAAEASTLQRTLASMAGARGEAAGEAGVITSGDDPEVRREDTDAVPREWPRRLAVRNGDRLVLVNVKSIDWVEAYGDYVRIHAGGANHLVAERMHAVERLLDPRRFLRIHRSIIVRLDGVRELQRDPDGAGAIVLHDGVRLRVSRGRWDSLERALGIAKL
jgi:two-component system LytT family response regulator